MKNPKLKWIPFYVGTILILTPVSANCPPGHIRSALNGYDGVKFVEKSKSGKKIKNRVKVPPGGVITVGGSACPIAFQKIYIDCVDENGNVIAKKTVDLRNQCTPTGCMVAVAELECKDEPGKVIQFSITPKGKKKGPVGVGYKGDGG